ncbi:trigger factor [Entomobacter blattae]|uniref:Trigger factor n=1 Tax=Entomobacter blattae TaxID=2762277 RepID=A0A7H1NSW4_9PROT|nr:trigger factor [Entomobacter blattae]QNT78874.1 Trigger factor [Entomobacter blattae]
MQVQETLSEGLKRNFTITIPADTVEGKRTERLQELAKTIDLPGFRPGKVPAALVKQRYGKAVHAEVLEQVVGESLNKAMEERGFRPAFNPKVDIVKGNDESKVEDVEIAVETEILPDFDIPEVKGLSLTRYKSEPTEESIENALQEIAKRQREYEDSDQKRPAAVGDVMNVDFIGKMDGVPFEGGTATDVNVEIGGSGFIPGFAEQVEGMSPGEEKTITVTFPENYQAQNLAGKEATFDIKANGFKKAVEVTIDDAMAQKLGFPALEALKDMIRRQIDDEYNKISYMRIKREILDKLAEIVDFAVPETLVVNEFNQIWQQIEADKKADRLDEDDKNKNEETLKSDYRKIAERRVRLGILLAEIGRVNSITVTQDEFANAIRNEAMRYPGQEQQVFDFFRQNPQVAESLRGPLFEDKVIKYIIESADIKDEMVTAEQLTELPPAKLS